MPAIIPIAAVVIGSVLQGNAADDAADAISENAAENTRYLEEQGARGAGLITDSERAAITAAQGITGAAITPIQQFADVGRQAFERSTADILAGKTEGALATSIGEAGQQAVGGGQTADVNTEIARRSNLTGQSFAPGVSQELLGVGRTGLSATGDIEGIRLRQAETIGDIARQASAARASATIGQAPIIAAQQQAGQDARLLAGLGRQNVGFSLAEQAAQLAGRNL